MSNLVDEFLAVHGRRMPFSVFKRIKAIRTASDEAEAKYVPEPDAPTIRAGGVSGVGAVIAGNGMITRYTLDRDRYGGLPGGSREISITMGEDGFFKVEADGHYRIVEEGEGSDEFDNNDMTPDGEWKNKKTGKISIPKKMKEEKVETHGAVTTASAPKKSKRGSLESRMTEGKQNRYDYNQRDMEGLDSTL